MIKISIKVAISGQKCEQFQTLFLQKLNVWSGRFREKFPAFFYKTFQQETRWVFLPESSPVIDTNIFGDNDLRPTK